MLYSGLFSCIFFSPHKPLLLFTFFEFFLLCFLWTIHDFPGIRFFFLSSIFGRVLVPIAFSLLAFLANARGQRRLFFEFAGALLFLLFMVIPGELSTKTGCQDFEECGQFEFLELDAFLHSLCFATIVISYCRSIVSKVLILASCMGYGTLRFLDYSQICPRQTVYFVVSRCLAWFVLFMTISGEISKKTKKHKAKPDLFQNLLQFSESFVFAVDKRTLSVIEMSPEAAELCRKLNQPEDFLNCFQIPNGKDKPKSRVSKMILKIPSETDKMINEKKSEEKKIKTLLCILKKMRSQSVFDFAKTEIPEGGLSPTSKPSNGVIFKENQVFLESVTIGNCALEAKEKSYFMKINVSENGKWFLVFAKEELEKKIWENASSVMNQVCHDIRNPASTIELLCKKAKFESSLNENIKKTYISTIKTSATIIQVLSEDLLDVFLMKQGKFKLRNQLLSFKKVFSQAKKITEAQIGEKHVKVLVEIDQDVPGTIRTDKDRFFQILLNLLSNARKFTESGSITMRAQRDKDNEKLYRVSVSDTGIGMKTEFLDVIGKEGIREENEVSSVLNPKGIGLGLSFCKKLALLIGPSGLLIASKPGEGSEFSFSVLDIYKCSNDFIPSSKVRNKAQNNREQLKSNSNHTNANIPSSLNLESSFLGVCYPKSTSAIPITALNKDIVNATSFELADEFEKEEYFGEVPNEMKSVVGSLDGSPLGITGRMMETYGSSRVPPTFVPHLHGKKDQKNTNFIRAQTIKKKQDAKRQLSDQETVFILLADDDNFNLMFLEEQLKSLNRNGLKIKKARNGKAAWEEYKKFLSKETRDLPAAVFLDNQMPLMKGVEVAESITKLCESLKRISPFLILVSGDRFEEEEGMKYFDFSLLKPINKNHLRDLMIEMELLPETRQE